jgi:hypothetical protein
MKQILNTVLAIFVLIIFSPIWVPIVLLILGFYCALGVLMILDEISERFL